MIYILIICTIYVLWYVLNFHSLFTSLQMSDSVLAKLVKCPLCFAFWVGFVPAILLIYTEQNAMFMMMPALTATANQIIAKYVIED